MVKEFQIINSIEGLNALKIHLERIAHSWNLSKQQLFEINFIIEEICANFIEHVEDSAESPIGVKLHLEKAKIFITVTDKGPEFDPTKITDPDVHLPIDKRKAGGLGLYLVRHYADSISYVRNHNINTLYIEKKLQ
jgi:serine/threonine-protein kinase RsbW